MRNHWPYQDSFSVAWGISRFRCQYYGNNQDGSNFFQSSLYSNCSENVYLFSVKCMYYVLDCFIIISCQLNFLQSCCYWLIIYVCRLTSHNLNCICSLAERNMVFCFFKIINRIRKRYETRLFEMLVNKYVWNMCKITCERVNLQKAACQL